MNIKNFSLLLFSIAMMMTSCGSGDDPTVTITGPADGASFSAGDALVMLGRTMDADGEISTLSVESGSSALQLSGNIDISAEPNKADFPWQATINLNEDLTPGEYLIDVIATDNDGNQGSDRLTFNIQ